MGIDHGDRRIGIAISDPMHILARPKETIYVSDTGQALSRIKEIIESEDVELIVLGLPYGMRGNETKQTVHVRKFGILLENTGNKVVYIDERLSSKSAKDALVKQKIKPSRNKDLVDQTAAAFILQQYLDSRKK